MVVLSCSADHRWQATALLMTENMYLLFRQVGIRLDPAQCHDLMLADTARLEWGVRAQELLEETGDPKWQNAVDLFCTPGVTLPLEAPPEVLVSPPDSALLVLVRVAQAPNMASVASMAQPLDDPVVCVKARVRTGCCSCSAAAAC